MEWTSPIGVAAVIASVLGFESSRSRATKPLS